MEANDFWTFVGLVLGAFAIVVAPRLFAPGHTADSVIYIAGGTVVLLVAAIARRRTRRRETEAAASTSSQDAVQ
jgi:membrane protease YdiL (CAAX protease family)